MLRVHNHVSVQIRELAYSKIHSTAVKTANSLKFLFQFLFLIVEIGRYSSANYRTQPPFLIFTMRVD